MRIVLFVRRSLITLVIGPTHLTLLNKVKQAFVTYAEVSLPTEAASFLLVLVFLMRV